MRIDGLQYCNWSPEIFQQMAEGRVDCVHVTIAYHENFREMVAVIESWNRFFEHFSAFRGGDRRQKCTEIDGTTRVASVLSIF